MPPENLIISGRLAQPSDRLAPGLSNREAPAEAGRTLRSEQNHPLLASRVAPPRKPAAVATGRKEDERKRGSRAGTRAKCSQHWGIPQERGPRRSEELWASFALPGREPLLHDPKEISGSCLGGKGKDSKCARLLLLPSELPLGAPASSAQHPRRDPTQCSSRPADGAGRERVPRTRVTGAGPPACPAPRGGTGRVEDVRYRDPGAGSEIAEGARRAKLDGPHAAAAPGTVAPRRVSCARDPGGGGDLRLRLQADEPGAGGGALSPCGSQ